MHHTTRILYVSPSNKNGDDDESKKQPQRRIPSEINDSNVKDLLKKNGYSAWEDNSYVEKCCWFLKLVFNKQLTDLNFRDTGYVHLMTELFKAKLGKNKNRAPHYYRHVLDTLEDIGLLEIDRHYTYGHSKGESMGYCIKLSNASSLVTDKKITDGTTWKIMDEQHLTEVKSMVLDDYMMCVLNNILPIHKAQIGMWIQDFWHNHAHYVKVDKNHRIHSLLTQLPKEYRCCFHVDGEAIYQADLHACQPYLFLGEILNFIKNQTDFTGEIPDDIVNYSEQIQMGVFYENLYRIFLKKVTRRKSQPTIGDFKIELLKNVFFGESITTNANICMGIFAKQYPTAYLCLKELKNREGYKYISQVLQQKESVIMDKVINVLRRNALVDWQVRFHDAVLCRQLDTTVVEKVIQDVCIDEITCKPCVKTGLWGGSFDKVMNQQYIPTLQFSNWEIAHEVQRLTRITKNRKSIYRNPDKLAGKRQFKRYVDGLADDGFETSMKCAALNRTISHPSFWDEGNSKNWNQYCYDIICSNMDNLFKSEGNNSKWLSECIEFQKTWWYDRLLGHPTNRQVMNL